jgi:hypothetical protein
MPLIWGIFTLIRAISLPGGDQLIADSERADPHIYGGDESPPDQTVPNLAGAQTPWTMDTVHPGESRTPPQFGAGADSQVAQALPVPPLRSTLLNRLGQGPKRRAVLGSYGARRAR